MAESFEFLPFKKNDFNAFLSLNRHRTAFIKQERISGSNVWRLCADDGTELATTDSRDLAFILARQHNLVPYSVH
ncbi:MAG: DUF1150 family protein [Alphaproteobacteria bacterium]|nr:DUF1150 family protein [Alphaproteobacteria bacterium]